MSDLPLQNEDQTAEPTSSPATVPIAATLTVVLPKWAPPLFFLLLAMIFLWRTAFTREVFLPATLLGHVAPWKSTALYPHLPAWNPLRWDGIGQFYPWRKFAAETLQSGFLPLWNPYQFCGTPFVANSQSAVFYPGNLLFYLLPDTAYAFCWSAILHLTLCGWFTYLLLKRMACSELAALVGGVVFAYSAWQVAWLQLPTFLATSCWIPLLLMQTLNMTNPSVGKVSSLSVGEERGFYRFWTGFKSIVALGLIVGMMILAGHLQIALYGLLTGACFVIGLATIRRVHLLGLVKLCAGLTFGFVIAMPQLLPSIELSRISHRVGKPSSTGYTAYTDYALPPAGIVQTLLPDFFGGDSDPGNPYWAYYRMHIPGGDAIAVVHNPAETAIYVGILPLALVIFACSRGLSRQNIDRRTVFFALLGLLALLLAFGTPANALFYFGIPGFSQSGSPARCLVLWALSSAALSSIALDEIVKRPAQKQDIAVVFGTLAVIAAIGVTLAIRMMTAAPPGAHVLPKLTEALTRISSDWIRFALIIPAAMWLLRGTSTPNNSSRSGLLRSPQATTVAALAVVILDLFTFGIGRIPPLRVNRYIR